MCEDGHHSSPRVRFDPALFASLLRHSGSKTVCLDRSITCRTPRRYPCWSFPSGARTRAPADPRTRTSAVVAIHCLAEASRGGLLHAVGFHEPQRLCPGRLGVPTTKFKPWPPADEARFARWVATARTVERPGEWRTLQIHGHGGAGMDLPGPLGPRRTRQHCDYLSRPRAAASGYDTPGRNSGKLLTNWRT